MCGAAILSLERANQTVRITHRDGAIRKLVGDCSCNIGIRVFFPVAGTYLFPAIILGDVDLIFILFMVVLHWQ